MNIVITHLEMNTACVCMYTMGGVIKEVSLFSYFMCHKQRYTVQLVQSHVYHDVQDLNINNMRPYILTHTHRHMCLCTYILVHLSVYTSIIILPIPAYSTQSNIGTVNFMAVTLVLPCLIVCDRVHIPVHLKYLVSVMQLLKHYILEQFAYLYFMTMS